MKRFVSILAGLLVVFTLSAQSPEAILESVRKYPNLAFPTGSTYPSIPLGEIAPTPEGFEPFYFSLTGRHGSRYELSDNSFKKALNNFKTADSLGILTDDGKLLLEKIKEIDAAQQNNGRQLSHVGVEQWYGIGERAYKNFSKVFDSGSVEAKSSTAQRCISSMNSFTKAIKDNVPSASISQTHNKSDLYIIRPLKNNPDFSKHIQKYLSEQVEAAPWRKEQKAWIKSYDVSSFLSKVSTDPDLLGRKCGEKYPFHVARRAFMALQFGENFGKGDRELLTRLFTPEEMYGIYVCQTAKWVYGSIGRGDIHVEARQAYMRTLVDDVINKADAAIKGKNPDVANLRFTHDSYMGPLFSVLGYKDCVPQWSEDLELATTSFNYGTIVPMASNLQIILYRNKRGDVFVRSLINERDGYLPIKCKTAPFYPWSDFCKYVYNHLKQFDASKDKVLKKLNN